MSDSSRPEVRIIQIADSHFVDKADIKIDMEHAHNKKLSNGEVEEMYKDFLLQVEMVEVEQVGLIRCLRHHGETVRIETRSGRQARGRSYQNLETLRLSFYPLFAEAQRSREDGCVTQMPSVGNNA